MFPKNLVQTEIEDASDEIELLGFNISVSMFDLVRTQHRGEVMAKELKDHVGKTVRMIGNFVTDKHFIP